MSKLIGQYQQIKTKYKDAILLFRVGDHYESFNEDAKIIADVMKITIAEKEDNEKGNISASLPFYSLDCTLHKLLNRGYKVAVCEELEDPKKTKGLPKRGVTDFL